ncbi:hypothetical protein [Rhodobacter capsulatus]|nr:hypothetical protein [Rhodobacter capsulatus]
MLIRDGVFVRRHGETMQLCELFENGGIYPLIVRPRTNRAAL